MRCVGKQRDVRTYTRFPLLRGERSGELMKKTRSGITYAAGRSFIALYKGIREKIENYDGALTSVNARNITSMRCEVNMTRK